MIHESSASQDKATTMNDHEYFESPFSWRYGSPQMRTIWGETYKRRLWRRIWVALAAAQQTFGLVTAEQVADLRAQANNIDLARAQAIEAEIHHDLVAEVKTYAEQCPLGGGIIHLGATSTDIEDNADAIRLRAGLDLLLSSLARLLETLAGQIERWAEVSTIAFTHLQPAEPTTIGYRLAQYGLDLLTDWQELGRIRTNIRGKGFKGAVGTSAAYAELLARPRSGLSTGSENEPTPTELEAAIMAELDLRAFLVSTQTYPRKQDWLVLNALAGLAGSLYKFAFDLRLLQMPLIGEWAEPFGQMQVGSSAMPFKRNPINAENIDSLARLVAALPRVAWDNAAHSLLERTLDDSANRREILPVAFLAVDEILARGTRLIQDLQIDRTAVAQNLGSYSPFAATERVLLAAVKAGGDRQTLHEVLRHHSLAAWADLTAGRPNSLADRLCHDAAITTLVPVHQIQLFLESTDYVGDAPSRARLLATELRTAIGELF
jgi:adenylosuccinate lyase